MTATRRSRLTLTAAALLALSAVPAAAGSFRLLSLPALALDRFAIDLGVYQARLDRLDSRAYQDIASRGLETSQVPDPAEAKGEARLSRFARLAGKFMGRADLAAIGGLRLRFKIVLE